MTLFARLTRITKQPSIRWFGLFAGVILLNGCGSTGSTPAKPAVAIPIENPKPEVNAAPRTPEEFIQQAKIAWQQNDDLSSRNAYLLAAADGYSTQECGKTLTIISKIYPEIAIPENQTYADLLIAECSGIDQISHEVRAQLVATPAATLALTDRQKRLQAQLFADQKQWLAAAQSLAQLSVVDAQLAKQIWHFIKRVDYSNQQASMNRYPNLRQWLALSAMLHRYGMSPQQLAFNFDQFAREFPAHPLVLHTPSEFIDGMAVTFKNPMKLAVVLPLTGRLEVQGNAIKQGILTAYFDTAEAKDTEQDNQQVLRFYDSNALSIEELAAELQDAELVIGPLLKSNIEALTPKLPASAVLVALNRVDLNSNERVSNPISIEPEIQLGIANDPPTFADEAIGPLHEQRFYFALAPEDEAQQLATYIYQQGYRSPILVHALDAIGQRLASAFLSQWQSLTDQQTNDGMSVVSYSDNDAMRDGISSALDVAQSKERIKQLERQLIPELYNVPRNRRDVDVIVAFATPEQTELLNPIVESSLSPFSDKDVPVYVTSRSISLDITKNQLRDLQNVHFLDLPWMMPDHSWLNLSTQVNGLYPNQRDSTKRLFALGYDAFSQVPVLSHLAAIPQLSISALSGELSINQYQQVIRKLPLAVIDDEKVKVLVEH